MNLMHPGMVELYKFDFNEFGAFRFGGIVQGCFYYWVDGNLQNVMSQFSDVLY